MTVFPMALTEVSEPSLSDFCQDVQCKMQRAYAAYSAIKYRINYDV